MEGARPQPQARVVTQHEVSADIRDREVEALTRHQLARRSVWAAHRSRWVRLLTGAVLVVVGLLVVPGVPWSVALGAGVAIALLAVVDVVLWPRRVQRVFARLLAAQDPPGTPVETVVTGTGLEITTPRATHRIPFDMVTQATWAHDVLVLEVTPTSYAVPGEALSGPAWAMLRPALADRLLEPDDRPSG